MAIVKIQYFEKKVKIKLKATFKILSSMLVKTRKLHDHTVI